MDSREVAINNAKLVPEAAKTALQTFWKNNSKHIMSVTLGKDPDAIAKVTYSMLYRNPKLIQCSPFSLLNGIVLANQLGLVFGTPEVSLVPFGSEATLIIGYQGKAKLALASGLITSIEAEIVYKGEKFTYRRTQNGLEFEHVPNWENRPAATEHNIVGVYCQLGTKGGVQTRFVPLSEILDARSRSRGYKYQKDKEGGDTPWITAFGAMALKTAVHRAMKLAPQDARMGLASAIEEEDEGSGQAVIAEGLNPAEFSERDLLAPLVDTGEAAAQAIVPARIAEEKAKKAAPKPAAVKEAAPPAELPVETAGSSTEIHELDFEGEIYRVPKAEWKKFQADVLKKDPDGHERAKLLYLQFKGRIAPPEPEQPAVEAQPTDDEMFNFGKGGRR